MSLHLLFFFNDTATTEIYTLSLHDALPILDLSSLRVSPAALTIARTLQTYGAVIGDRKSTRLNSSHANISYAVFCLKKKSACLRRRASPRHHTSSHPRTDACGRAARTAAGD